MTNELTDLEQTKMQKRDQRATKRRQLAEAFSGSLRDTLRWAALIASCGIVAICILWSLIGNMLLLSYLYDTYGNIGLLLLVLAECVLAFIIVVICRTLLRVRKTRKNRVS